MHTLGQVYIYHLPEMVCGVYIQCILLCACTQSGPTECVQAQIGSDRWVVGVWSTRTPGFARFTCHFWFYFLYPIPSTRFFFNNSCMIFEFLLDEFAESHSDSSEPSRRFKRNGARGRNIFSAKTGKAAKRTKPNRVFQNKFTEIKMTIQINGRARARAKNKMEEERKGRKNTKSQYRRRVE